MCDLSHTHNSSFNLCDISHADNSSFNLCDLSHMHNMRILYGSAPALHQRDMCIDTPHPHFNILICVSLIRTIYCLIYVIYLIRTTWGCKLYGRSLALHPRDTMFNIPHFHFSLLINVIYLIYIVHILICVIYLICTTWGYSYMVEWRLHTWKVLDLIPDIPILAF